MSLYLCIFEGDQDIDGIDVGSYGDFNAIREHVVVTLEDGNIGSKYPTFALHSDSEGEWSVVDCVTLLKELAARPESGFLGHIAGMKVIVQYWRSFEHLDAYAKSQDREHWPAWVAFNKSVGNSRGDVGIWHETFQAHAGEYETVYSGMPPFGLGKVGKLVPATGRRESARGRFGARVQST